MGDMSLSPEAIKYLECRTPSELSDSYNKYDRPYLDEAWQYLLECPISELPKYINNPSIPIKRIIQRRLGSGLF